MPRKSSPLTKADFDQALQRLATKDDLKRFATKDDLNGLATKTDLERSTEILKESIRGLNTNLNTSQGFQNDRFDRVDDRLEEVNVKLDAIMELLTTRKQLAMLVQQLKTQGIKIDEAEIFAA